MERPQMTIKQTTPPAAEPVTLADVEGQCRESLAEQSAIINLFIAAVRQRAEAMTRRALVTQQWRVALDRFPSGRDPIILPLPPLQTVEIVKYIDGDGIEQTMDPLTYRVITDAEPGQIIPVYGGAWPSARSDVGAVTVEFTCGYGDAGAAVPEGIRQWILMNVAALYENREVTGIAAKGAEFNFTSLADGLIFDFRVLGW